MLLVIIWPGAALTGIFLIIEAEPSGAIVLKDDKLGDLIYRLRTGVNIKKHFNGNAVLPTGDVVSILVINSFAVVSEFVSNGVPPQTNESL